MKRPVLWILPVFLLLSWSLSRKAISPEHFTGIWYSTGGDAYRFQEGIIHRTGSDSAMDGAYAFAADSITLFVTELEDLGTVTTLYRISGDDGDLLCSTPGGSGTVYFSRTPPEK